DLLQARLVKSNIDRPGRVRAEVVGSGQEALDRLTRDPLDAVLTDLTMPGMDGIELVRRIRDSDPALPVFLMTSNATVERAVEGIRAGATEFLQKPVNVTALLTLVERAVAERPLREEVTALQERRAAATAGNMIFGKHPTLDGVRQFILQVARAPDARVLITGESGTGKSLLARAIHDLSDVPGRFIEVNCAALPPQLLESELFGHEKGAFTDAKTLKRGLIEAADRGTLLLDEIGTMPLDLQAKLLLFLESREIRRVGGVHPIAVRTRVIAATNEDLRERVRQRAFRQDLLYRLDVASVEMPPLRAMPSVIPELAERFVRSLAAELLRPLPELTESSFAALTDYAWPGNARELRNAVERALIFHAGGPLDVCPPAYQDDLGPQAPGLSLEYGLTLEEVERRYLEATLAATDGRELAEVAAELGISRKTLWEKRRRYGL
ncbi:MAG TPA: sigma-54 dependent transcriptional regulator, partial [Longimicrobiaceae bacterium]|nr:sigma-54 dependent transcriptional regulator [Longimicrobiaceae bacterium]